MSITPQVHDLFSWGFTVGDVHSVGFDKCMVTCIDTSSVLWNSFTALNPPLHLSSLSPPKPLAAMHLVMALPFPESQVVGLIEQVGFSDWLLSLLGILAIPMSSRSGYRIVAIY